MKAKFFLIVVCLFCAGVLSAQDSPFIQKWEQQARSRGASWNGFTRSATASSRPRYASLYLKGKFLASFNDDNACRKKIDELVGIADDMYSKSAAAQTGSSSKKNKGQATRDLERMTGVDLSSIGGTLDRKKAESDAKRMKEIRSQVRGYCECRSESNPNYKSGTTPVKPVDFGNGDLFAGGNSDAADNTPDNPLLDGVQTQFNNPFDAPSARDPQPAQQGAQPGVSLNFDDADQYADGIRVGDNYKGIIPQQPVYLEDLNDYNYANWTAKQNPNGMYAVLPQDKERGIQLAKDLLPLAEERLANFDKTMAEIESTENKIISEYDNLISQTERQSAIAEYQKGIADYGDNESKYAVSKYDLKNKFGLTEEEILSIRRDVVKEVTQADWRKTFKSDEEVFNGETLEGAIARDIIVPASRSLDLLNGSEVKMADARNEMRLLDLQDKYKKTFENSRKNLSALMDEKTNQLDKINESKKRYTAEKDDILKAKSYYSNVIQNGKIVITSENGIDAMNCGNILNSIIVKR
ncbi:MAG: hypothetical protein LBK97_05095 [Prevotellaceae bacterium]|jgi:hypothetical protein|nr:hypothetical protein [Prevotellaceae bacterium]